MLSIPPVADFNSDSKETTIKKKNLLLDWLVYYSLFIVVDAVDVLRVVFLLQKLLPLLGV